VYDLYVMVPILCLNEIYCLKMYFMGFRDSSDTYLLVVHLIMILALWFRWIENKTQGFDICPPGRLASVL
jgi:hypothetical protein